MKRQFIFVLTFISFFFFSNSVTAQVNPKKKAVTSSVKKGPASSKKSSAQVVKKTTAKATPANVTPIVNTPVGRNTCKVVKTKEGCTIIFEFNLDPNSEMAKKGDTYSKKEFSVSYLDNAVTEVGKVDDVKVIKNAAPVMVDKGADEVEVNVAIKDVMVVFDVEKNKRELPKSANEFVLPNKLEDGFYVMYVNWAWDMPSDKVTKPFCSTMFKMVVQEGNYVRVSH
jgi:hypothetical protein